MLLRLCDRALGVVVFLLRCIGCFEGRTIRITRRGANGLYKYGFLVIAVIIIIVINL
jgi:hypothetical protein